MEVGGQLHTLAALSVEREPQYPFYGRLIGPLGQFRCCTCEKYLLFLTGIDTQFVIVQSIA
jgi:hypothetical protein